MFAGVRLHLEFPSEKPNAVCKAPFLFVGVAVKTTVNFGTVVCL
jgi:hypothetical protein